MKAHKKEAKGSVYKLVLNVFNLLVILGLAFQPMSPAGMYSISLAKEKESESNIESAVGSIRVCKIIVDAGGNVVDGAALPGSVFTVSGFTPDPMTSEGDPVGVLPVSTFTTGDLLNARILNSSTGNDARCVTYNDLALGGYYYEEEVIYSPYWEGPKYNDQFTSSVLAVSDFFLYDGNLFDGDSSDDGSRDTNVDGHIILTDDRTDRTLVVLNQYMLAVISGFKWNDEDGDGEFDEGEEKLSGWIIFVDDNQNGALDNGEISTITDENGDYNFSNIIPGSYRVCEARQTSAGWTQTFPQNQINNCHNVVVIPGQTSGGNNFGNRFISPVLEISKSNDSSSPENPGNSVTYTITVTAPESNLTDVEEVKVTDLPPEGFEFISGSDVASTGFLTSPYASPGVWSLGTMTPGQVVTLSYQTTISGSQDAGLYNDLAFAKGTSAIGGDVFANAPNPFVGTDVEVVLPTPPANVELVNTTERNVDTKTIHKTKKVLGAATILPSTGANINTILSALMLLLGGLILLLLSKRSTWNLIKSLGKSMSKAIRVSLFVMIGVLLASHSVNAAAGDLKVEIEQPKAVINNQEFKVGFVVLDISATDSIDVECEVAYEAGTFGEFDTYTIAAGGTSGNCNVDAVDMPADGAYTFRVTAEEQEGSDSDVATAAPIELVSGTPSTPLNYSRVAGSCTASFTTANDGLTDKVEMYRSLSSTFTADGTTFVGNVSILPNTSGTITDPNGDCGGSYFYAIRAVAASGLISGFVGDANVTIDNENKIKTETDTKHIAGPVTTAGAIPVSGGETAGAVEGATIEETGETVQPSDEQEGSVLGSATEAAGAAAGGIVDWIKSHPWWSLFWLTIIVLIAYFARRIYFGNYNENNQ